MSKADETVLQKDDCACPFCDVSECPDPREEQSACGCGPKVDIHLVDCVGLYCPVPVMRAKEEIDRLEVGGLMELIADDPASAEDIPRWAKRTGHTLLAMRKVEEDYHFLLQKEAETEEE